MLKLLVGVIFLSGFLDISVVSVDKEDGQRVNDDGSESNIAFDSADLTAAVRAVNGEYQLEAYRSINNDRILLEISKEQNSANLLKISQLRWMSIGQPMFVKMPDVWNDSELFHESDDGFSTHIQMLTLDHRKELASVARRKYSLNITADQITNLVLSKFECRLIMFDQHEEKHLLTGIVTDFRHFPLRMDFDAPLRSTARKLFLKERRSIDLKFKCGLCTKGKLMRTNTLSITAQQIQDFGLEESLLGKASGNESKDVFVSRNQLSELANEMYSKLNILEEYEMPEHTFSDAFVHGLIGQITSSQFSQVPIDEALSSLSKYGFDVREDLRPDVIKRDLESILTVEDFGNKSEIIVDKDEYKKLELSAAGKVLAKFGIPIEEITIGVEAEVDLLGSGNNESKVKSLKDQLNELNSKSRNDMKWEFEGKKVVPKSLNVARLTRSKFSRTLTFNRVRTQSYNLSFSRQFTLYTHRALPEKLQSMCFACKSPMRHRLKQLETELKTKNRQMGRVTSELKATTEHLQNCLQPGKNDEQDRQITGTDQSTASILFDLKPGCPSDFTYLPASNKCYRLVTDRMSWDAARLRCNSLHRSSHSVIINDQSEQNAIVGFFNSINGIVFSKCYDRDCVHIWTAGQRIDPSRNSPFIWKPDNDTWKPMTYVNWSPEQPDFCNSVESCMHFTTYPDYKVNDVACGEESNFCTLRGSMCVLCEVDMG